MAIFLFRGVQKIGFNIFVCCGGYQRSLTQFWRTSDARIIKLISDACEFVELGTSSAKLSRKKAHSNSSIRIV